MNACAHYAPEEIFSTFFIFQKIFKFIDVYVFTEDKSETVKGEFYKQLEREYNMASAWETYIKCYD